MTDAIKAKMQALIAEAKNHKAMRDMANMDYKYTMKKLRMLTEAHPDIARELGLFDEKV
jgi:hypothetical protein